MSEFKKLAEPGIVKPMIERLQALAEAAMAHPDWSEPTFRCPDCKDTQFIIREDSKGRKFGRRCRCLELEIASKPKDTVIKFSPRVVDSPIDDDEGLPF